MKRRKPPSLGAWIAENSGALEPPPLSAKDFAAIQKMFRSVMRASKWRGFVVLTAPLVSRRRNPIDCLQFKKGKRK